MASQEELAPLHPETLPDDFSEWDGEGSPAPSPVNSREWEAWEAAHSFAKAPKAVWHSPERQATMSTVVDKPRGMRSAPPAPAPVKPQKDFDREPSPVPLRVNSNEWEAWAAAHSLGKSAAHFGHSTEREAILSPVVEKPREARRVTPVPAVPKQRESASDLEEKLPVSASHASETGQTATEGPAAPSGPSAAPVDETHDSPEPAETLGLETDGALFQSISVKNIESIEGRKSASKKKKWIILGAASTCLILPPLMLLVPLLHHGAKPIAQQSVQPLPAAADSDSQTDMPKPSASEPLNPAKPAATTAKQQTAEDRPANKEEGVDPPAAVSEAQTKMMDDQLTAPTQIPKDANKQDAENAPPAVSFGPAGADGLGGIGTNVSIFNGHAQTVVKASRPVAISSGVATGLLLQKTAPAYPPIARTARVAGTVELHATISKNGTIKDLQVLNGPVMLRQAAVDAVRTWRYKPYKLDNQPVEVETTINVVFTLGQ